MNSSEPLTVGVIGCGQITETVHLPVLTSLRANIRWIIDSNQSQAAKVADVFGSDAFPSSTDLGSLPPVRVVLISCPYGVRLEYYEKLKSAMPTSAILIEKPIALTLQEHDQIGSLRDDWMIAAGYNRRASANVNLARQLVADGFLGDPRSAAFRYGGIGVTTGGNYRANIALAGGGPLFETGVHGIDAINYILDAQSAKVNDVAMQIDHGFDVHTQANYDVHRGLDEKQAVPCQLLITLLQHTANGITIWFDSCSLEFSLFGGGVSLRSNRTNRSVDVSESPAASRDGFASTCRFWRDFLRAIDSGEVNYTNLSTSRLTTAILDDVYMIGKGSGR